MGVKERKVFYKKSVHTRVSMHCRTQDTTAESTRHRHSHGRGNIYADTRKTGTDTTPPLTCEAESLSIIS